MVTDCGTVIYFFILELEVVDLIYIFFIKIVILIYLLNVKNIVHTEFT